MPATCGCHSRRRAGGRSPGTPRGARPPPAASSSCASSSNERPSVPPAPAVFSRCSSQPSLSASASRSSRRRARSPRRRGPSWPSRGAGPRRWRRSPGRRAASGSARQRLGADLGILAGAVEQVDGVDQHRVDRACGHRLAERRDVLLACSGRPPHARRLVEDLDRLGSRAPRRVRSPLAGRRRARRARRLARRGRGGCD